MSKQRKAQKIKISNRILLKEPVQFRKEIQEAFQITNPKYLASLKYGRKKYKPKKYLIFWSSTDQGVDLPRGSLNKIKNFYKKRKIPCIINDCTVLQQKIDWNFNGKMRPEKGQLGIKNFKGNTGLIVAPTGSGKTVMFLYLMSKFKCSTLIVVHTNLLISQWTERISQFLDTPKKDIGVIGGGKSIIKPVTISTVQTLSKHPELVNNFDTLCIDEAHKAPALSYVKPINEFKGRYLIGLTATPKREDGLTSVMKWHLGGVNTTIELKNTDLCPCFYKVIPTEFIPEGSLQHQYSKTMVELARNKKRNELIIQNVIKHINEKGAHLIISQNRTQCLKFYKTLPKHLRMISCVLTGRIGKPARKTIVDKIKNSEIKLVFATDKLIGEGFDEPVLSVIHLTSPIKSPKRLIQYVGRVRRPYPGKERSLVFDYFDFNEGIFRKSMRNRLKIYRENDIKKLEDIKNENNL